jgi:fructose-1,6-bisphosphatase/inositol monophosphatase family enzyme
MRTPAPGARVRVCDPVDGTWLIAGGMPYTVMSLALVEDGQPVIAVVHDPHTRRTFTATAGSGAYCGRRLSVNQATTRIRLHRPNVLVHGVASASM